MPLLLSAPEEKLLHTLWRRGALTTVQAKTDRETVRRLVSADLIVEHPASKKGNTRLVLTDAGRKAAADLPREATLPEILRHVTALRAEVECLRRLVSERLPAPVTAATNTPPSMVPNPKRQPGHVLVERILEAAATIDQRNRLGGLIPLPLVRDAIDDLNLPRDELDDALLALEEQYVIDLKVANDPARLPDPHQGIDCPNRGLLYFLVVR